MWGNAVINPESIFFKVLIFQNICKRYSKISAVSDWVQVPFCARLFKGQSNWDWKKYNLLSNLKSFLWRARSSSVRRSRKGRNMQRKASTSAACATVFFLHKYKSNNRGTVPAHRWWPSAEQCTGMHEQTTDVTLAGDEWHGIFWKTPVLISIRIHADFCKPWH